MVATIVERSSKHTAAATHLSSFLVALMVVDSKSFNKVLRLRRQRAAAPEMEKWVVRRLEEGGIRVAAVRVFRVRV